MDFYKVIDVIEKPITGEWGEEGSGVKVLRTTNFTNSGEINYSDVVERNIDFKKISQKKLKIGDTILEKSGGSPTQPVGRVVYFDKESNENYLCNNFTTILRPKVNVFSKYLFWNLFYNHIIKKTISFQNKTTGIINLQTERYLKETKIPLPPLATQKAIAEKLDKADALRKKDQELLKQYDELAQSIFIDMFGDPVQNEKGWDIFSLCNFGEISTGNTPSRKEESYYNENFIEWIKTDNIIAGQMIISTANEYLSYEGSKKGRIIDEGALLVACIAGSIESIGRCALTDRKVCFNQQINAIQPNGDINSIFLYSLIKNSSKYIQDFASNGMKRMLSKGEFEKIPFIKPSLELQNQFAEKIKNIEAQKELVKKQAEASENLFQALLQESFSFT